MNDNKQSKNQPKREVEFQADHRMYIRHATLAVTEGQPTQDRADALNLMEMILDDALPIDQMVEAIASGSVKEVYRPKVTG